jgi:hypothetical protein
MCPRDCAAQARQSRADAPIGAKEPRAQIYAHAGALHHAGSRGHRARERQHLGATSRRKQPRPGQFRGPFRSPPEKQNSGTPEQPCGLLDKPLVFGMFGLSKSACSFHHAFGTGSNANFLHRVITAQRAAVTNPTQAKRYRAQDPMLVLFETKARQRSCDKPPTQSNHPRRLPAQKAALTVATV